MYQSLYVPKLCASQTLGTDPSVVIRHLSKFMLEMETLYYAPSEEDAASRSKDGSASVSSAGSAGPVVYGTSTAFVGFGQEIVPFATNKGDHQPYKLVRFENPFLIVLKIYLVFNRTNVV
jgi:hypothetical protein